MPMAQVTTSMGRPRSIRNPMQEDYRTKILEEHCWVINITEQTWTEGRTYGVFTIPGCKKGQSFTALKINGRVEFTDEGADMSNQVVQRANEIADDLCDGINGHITMPGDAPKSFLGVFVSNTPTPSKSRIEEAVDQLKEFGGAVVSMADGFWDDPRNHSMITDFHRRFCKLRNETRPWMFEAKSLSPCPACSTSVQPGLAKCPNCHAVLDMAKLKQFFPLEYAELQQLNEINKKPKE